MWNLKILKEIKINQEFKNLKILLPHINVHDMLRKIVIYYTRKKM
jgi:hypothetical protein